MTAATDVFIEQAERLGRALAAIEIACAYLRAKTVSKAEVLKNLERALKEVK